MKKATGFSEVYPKQAEKAQMLQEKWENGEMKNWQMHKGANSISNSVLRDDLCYKFESGKTLKLTDRTKALILEQKELLRNKGYLKTREYGGQCLICGKSFSSGDVVLADSTGEGHAVCLKCCTGKNEVKLDDVVELQECK